MLSQLGRYLTKPRIFYCNPDASFLLSSSSLSSWATLTLTWAIYRIQLERCCRILILFTCSLQKYPKPTMPATASSRQMRITDRRRLDLGSILLISYTPSVKCNPKTLSTCTDTLLVDLALLPPPESRNPLANAVIVPHHKLGYTDCTGQRIESGYSIESPGPKHFRIHWLGGDTL